MEDLTIPIGDGRENVHVSEGYNQYMHPGPVVQIDLPNDGRVFNFDRALSLYHWLGEWLMANPKPKDPLPTKMHATIRANITGGRYQGTVLTLVDTDEMPWRSATDGWFGPEDIESFEVLFPGVDS